MTSLDNDKKQWSFLMIIKTVCMAAVIAGTLCFQSRFSWILRRQGGAIAAYVGSAGRWRLAVRLTSLFWKEVLNHSGSINGIRRFPNIISAKLAGFTRMISGEATQAFTASTSAFSIISLFVTIWWPRLMTGSAWALPSISPVADHSDIDILLIIHKRCPITLVSWMTTNGQARSQ